MITAVRTASFVVLLVLTALSACSEPGPPARPKPLVRFAALPERAAAPADNPPSAAKAELGRLLFFDPILSGDQDVACATCHHPTNGWAEFRDLSIGVNGHGFGGKRAFRQPNAIPFVKRNAHTILNTAFNGMDALGRYAPERAAMFWDNRVSGLEAQALEPMLAFEEMRGERFTDAEILPEVVRRLRANATYSQLFTAAFGAEPTKDNLARAIAAFERTLITPSSRFDRYMRGDKDALSIGEIEGFEEFKRVGCGNCHNGPMFSDYKVHVLGVPEHPLLPAADGGPAGDFAFRTPSLRNLRFTAPYMHNGQFMTLMRVLEFYEDIAAGKEQNPNVSPADYDPLVSELTVRVREMRPIISFLNALNDENFDRSEPESVPSGLPVGGNIR